MCTPRFVVRSDKAKVLLSLPNNGSESSTFTLGQRWLDDGSASDQAVDDDDDRDDKQQVNQAATNVHHEEPKNPQDEQNYCDRPKHDGILARSELHPARQTVSPAWRAATRPGVMVPHGVDDGNLHACSLAPLRNICAEKLALRCGIVTHATARIDSGEGGQPVFVGAGIHDMVNLHSPPQCRIGN